MASGKIMKFDKYDLEEARSNMRQVILNGSPVDYAIDIMIRFNQSTVEREQKVFICMIRLVLEEFKRVRTYPLNKVKIIALLYGSLIKHGLLKEAYGSLGIALGNVFEGLVEPPESNMFIFGSTALELFVERLRELPFHRQFVLMIPHFHTKCPTLVRFIQSLNSDFQVPAQNMDAATPISGLLYVDDLGMYVDESQLHYIFSQVGEVMSARVCRDPVTRRGLGYGYVTYWNPQDAAVAKKKFSPPLNIRGAERVRRRGPTRVFFESFYKSLHDVFAIFWNFGGITSLEVDRQPSGDSKGSGFVNFQNDDNAAKAVECLNGKKIGDMELRVEFARQQIQRPSQMTPPSTPAPLLCRYNNPPYTQQLYYGQYPLGYFGYHHHQQQQQQLVPVMHSGGIPGHVPYLFAPYIPLMMQQQQQHQ